MADTPQQLGFPADFTWGAATASYQIEGAAREDGKGPSIWDIYSHTPGKVKNGDNGDIACDHYHRWQEDIGLMQEVGIDAYRFSISWPRVLPQGKGRVNQAGLDFYDRLVDGLLSAGIKPFVTLYHWDLPQALQENGGWANRDTAQAYADYAQIVAERLGDRVSAWITHNEPWVVAFVGNLMGRHAPGLKSMRTAMAVTHHLLLSHGLAVPRLRSVTPNVPVGITVNLNPIYPASESEADLAAAVRKDGLLNRLFLDPLAYGRYPEDTLLAVGEDGPPVQPGDLDLVRAPLDFLGVNNYFREVIRDAPGMGQLDTEQIKPPGEYTTMGWEVYPDGLRALLERLQHDYPFKAYYITENGAAFPDQVGPDGHVHDDRRRAYLQAHFESASKALAAGLPLRGYFVWSLLDNFEWDSGYSQRFGITYVDYPTEKRILKDSGLWYQQFLRARG